MHVRCVGLWLLAMFAGACDGFALGPSLALSRSQSKLMAPRPLRSTLARFEMSHARQQRSSADDRTERLLAAKVASGKTWDEIAQALGLQNAYTCQLFLGQAQLKPATAEKLKKIVPAIDDGDLAAMQEPPMRGFDSEILKEPNVYRTYEAITHYGEAIKMLINEQCGDGIMVT